MEPLDTYEGCTRKILNGLRVKKLREQMNELRQIDAKLVVLDFCGKTPTIYKLFSGINAEVFVVYDVTQCAMEISSMAKDYDIVYVLEDIERMESNLFHNDDDLKVIFLLFDRFRFVKCL